MSSYFPLILQFTLILMDLIACIFIFRSNLSDTMFDVTVGHIEDIIMGESLKELVVQSKDKC